MNISLYTEFVWSATQDRYILVRQKSINWTKGVAWCKGPSPQQTALANSQTSFYNTLTSDYNTQFANQSAILGKLNSSLAPILAAGPNQQGFSAGQLENLNSSAVQGVGQNYGNASKGLREQQAAAGGGTIALPSGAQNAQQAALTAAGANQASQEELGIQAANYQQGNAMYNNAVSGLGNVAGMYNPTGYAGDANQGGSAAGTEWNQIAAENQAADPFNAILGAVGGAASSYLGGLGKAQGSK